jgi:hypothetical protein
MENASLPRRMGRIDRMATTPNLILCLALILSSVLMDCSTTPQRSTVAVTPEEGRNAASKQHFKDYLAKCDTNELRCVWFLQDNPRIGMVMTIRLDQETVLTGRDFYGWALQGGDGNRRLSHPQVLTLKQIICNLPPSDKMADFNKSVFTSVRNGKNVEVFQYDRHRCPAIILRVYDIGGGYFETNTATL